MRLLPSGKSAPRTIGIVGGGLFHRTALICKELFRDSSITIIDADPAHLATARRWLDGTGVATGSGDMRKQQRNFTPLPRVQGRGERDRQNQELHPDGAVTFEQSWFDHTKAAPFDLLIIPLAYVGDSEALYRAPPSAQTIIHDWIWRKRGRGVIVSWFLLKRLNLITRQ